MNRLLPLSLVAAFLFSAPCAHAGGGRARHAPALRDRPLHRVVSVAKARPSRTAARRRVNGARSFPRLVANRNFFSAEAIEAVFRVANSEKWALDQSGALRELSQAEREARRSQHLARAIGLLRADFNRDPVTANLSDDAIGAFASRAARLQFVRHDELPAETEAAMEFERFRLYMSKHGINPDSRPDSFRALATQFGYSSLAHMTEIDSLPAILTRGELQPPRTLDDKHLSWSSNADYVYLEALPRYLSATYLDSARRHRKDYDALPKMLRLSDQSAYLEIDSRILDLAPWQQMNVHWRYGRTNEAYTIASSNMIAAFLNLQTDSDAPNAQTKWHFRNEFLMEKGVPLQNVLKAIHVAPELVEKTREDLRRRGVPAKYVDLVR